MCSHEGCASRPYYNIDFVLHCKKHCPIDLGMCSIIKKDGKACECPARRSFKSVKTCMRHIPKSSAVETCSICLEDCEIGTKSTVCGHFFHTKCLNEWKSNIHGHTCPVCRTEIAKPKIDEGTFQTLITVAHRASDADDFIDQLSRIIEIQDIYAIIRVLQS